MPSASMRFLDVTFVCFYFRACAHAAQNIRWLLQRSTLPMTYQLHGTKCSAVRMP